MKRMINMTNTYMDTDRFRDGRDAMDFAGEFGCDGLELMYCKGGREDFFPADGIVGVHLRYFNEWVDLWKGNMDALVAEYDSIEQAKEVFGGLDRSCIIRAFREDLERARRCRASYVVFHVSDVKPSELFQYRFLHTDEEVIDTSAELINLLLDGKGYDFEFLMENLWWPGLTMTRPEMTGRLLEQVHYPKKGIMLDTGHLMHTNLELATQEEAVDYILEKVREHGGLASYIRGMHLNQSLTGDYVKQLLKKKDQMPKTHKERMETCYNHVFGIDSHLPFTSPRVRELVETVAPEYLTYEFISNDRKDHEEKLRRQCRAFE